MSGFIYILLCYCSISLFPVRFNLRCTYLVLLLCYIHLFNVVCLVLSFILLNNLCPLHGTCRWIIWGSGPYVSAPLYAELDTDEGLFISLILSEEFGNVDKIGMGNERGGGVHNKELEQYQEYKKWFTNSDENNTEKAVGCRSRI